MKTSTKIILALLVILILQTQLILFLRRQYIHAVASAESSAEIISQNQKAYEDAFNQKVDSIQTLAVIVKKLNNNLDELRKKNRRQTATVTELRLEIDSLKSHGVGVLATGTDSVAAYKEVSFGGKIGILNYSGYTRFYLPPSQAQPTHYLQASFDEILVKSQLFRGLDNVWRIQTESLTPNIKLRTVGTIDENLYIGLRSSAVVGEREPSQLRTAPPLAGLRLKANVRSSFYLDKGRLGTLRPDVSAEAFLRSFNVTYYPLTKALSLGVVLQIPLLTERLY